METFWSRLLPSAMSVSMVLLRPGLVSMSVAHVATKDQRDAQGLDHNCGHKDVSGPCSHQGHADLSNFHCHLGP